MASSGLPLTFSSISNAGTINGNSLTITERKNCDHGQTSGELRLCRRNSGHPHHYRRQKTLTVSISGTNRLVGQPNPKSETCSSYSGFIGSENVSDLKKQPVVAFKATAASAQGTYVLSFTGGSDGTPVCPLLRSEHPHRSSVSAALTKPACSIADTILSENSNSRSPPNSLALSRTPHPGGTNQNPSPSLENSRPLKTFSPPPAPPIGPRQVLPKNSISLSLSPQTLSPQTAPPTSPLRVIHPARPVT